MTKQNWQPREGPEGMLESLRGKASDRKFRLFDVACCERIRNLMTRSGNKAVFAAEQFADGLIDKQQLHSAWLAVGLVKNEARRFACLAAQGASCPPEHGTTHTAERVIRALIAHSKPHETDRVRQAERTIQALFLRDIFGNRFRRSMTFDSAWRTDTAVSLARTMYEAREFGAMPILADALQDAGCDNTDILDHCRDPNATHVRGCWVVDLVLGKC